LLFPVALASAGLAAIFLTFSGIGILAFIFVLGLLPEKGRSLAQTEVDLRKRGQVAGAATPQPRG